MNKKNSSNFIASAMESLLNSEQNKVLFKQPYKNIFAAKKPFTSGKDFSVSKYDTGRHTHYLHPVRMDNPEIETPHPHSVYPYRSKLQRAISPRGRTESEIAMELASGEYDTSKKLEYFPPSIDPIVEIEEEVRLPSGLVEPEYQTLVYTEEGELEPPPRMFPHEYEEEPIDEKLLEEKLKEFKKLLLQRKTAKEFRDKRKQVIKGKITNPALLEKILASDEQYNHFKHFVKKLNVVIQKFKEKSGFYNILEHTEREFAVAGMPQSIDQLTPELIAKRKKMLSLQKEEEEDLVGEEPHRARLYDLRPLEGLSGSLVVSEDEEDEEEDEEDEEEFVRPVTGKELSIVDEKAGGLRQNDDVVYTKEDGSQCSATIVELNRASDGKIKFIRIKYQDSDNQEKYKIINANSSSISLEE